MNRAFWTYTVCHTNSEPCQRYADQSVKIMRFGPQTSPYRAYTLPTGSNDADHWRIIQLVSWAFRGCVGSLVNFSPKFRCDQEGVQKRRFGPQTSPYRPYILPTGSNGADHWRILQRIAWAFQGCVGSYVKFQPKFRYARGGAQKR